MHRVDPAYGTVPGSGYRAATTSAVRGPADAMSDVMAKICGTLVPSAQGLPLRPPPQAGDGEGRTTTCRGSPCFVYLTDPYCAVGPSATAGSRVGIAIEQRADAVTMDPILAVRPPGMPHKGTWGPASGLQIVLLVLRRFCWGPADGVNCDCCRPAGGKRSRRQGCPWVHSAVSLYVRMRTWGRRDGSGTALLCNACIYLCLRR